MFHDSHNSSASEISQNPYKPTMTSSPGTGGMGLRQTYLGTPPLTDIAKETSMTSPVQYAYTTDGVLIPASTILPMDLRELRIIRHPISHYLHPNTAKFTDLDSHASWSCGRDDETIKGWSTYSTAQSSAAMANGQRVRPRTTTLLRKTMLLHRSLNIAIQHNSHWDMSKARRLHCIIISSIPVNLSQKKASMLRPSDNLKTPNTPNMMTTGGLAQSQISWTGTNFAFILLRVLISFSFFSTGLVQCYLSTSYYILPFLHIPSVLSDYGNLQKWGEPGFATFIVAICCLAPRHMDDPRVRANPTDVKGWKLLNDYADKHWGKGDRAVRKYDSHYPKRKIQICLINTVEIEYDGIYPF
ncbi:hypothetical protein EV361DRAFT_1007336 [Lentinula raphanica]|nr:hypothetical protein EV361DRAFT_1007336 [Lentinula raphanica]